MGCFCAARTDPKYSVRQGNEAGVAECKRCWVEFRLHNPIKG